MKKLLTSELVNIDISASEKNIFSSPLNPELDAEIAFEMDHQKDVEYRFGKSTHTSVEDTKKYLSSEKDYLIYSNLLDSSQGYNGEALLERAIRLEKNSPMIGWVCLYRVSPKRLNRYAQEGLYGNYNVEFPILEITYAKHASTPKGLIIHGIRAEIKHIDDLSENRRPTILAFIEKDNIPSMKLIEKLGFDYLGYSLYETEEEYEESGEYIEKYDNIYILNWEKFYLF